MHKLIITTCLMMALPVTSACAAKPSTLQSNLDKSALISKAYVKPGAGIGYAHDLKSQYSAGETVTFQLNLGESYDAGMLRVTVNSETLNVSEARSSVDFDMRSNEDHAMTVSFNAGVNGRHYIDVQALADTGDGNPMSRVFSIPVQVGPPIAQKPNAAMKTTIDGDSIIEMEAQEEIK